MKKRVFMSTLVLALILTGSVYADDLQDSFLSDLKEGLTERWSDDRDESTMTEGEKATYYGELVDMELEKIVKYEEEEFESAKFNALAHSYIRAVKLQKDALEIVDADNTLYETMWGYGYNLRAYIVPIFVDSYGLDLPEEDVQDFRDNSSLMTLVWTGDTDSDDSDIMEEVEKDRTKRTQELLNALGYDCGTPDGVAGQKTMDALHQFEEEYGYTDLGFDDRTISTIQSHLESTP